MRSYEIACIYIGELVEILTGLQGKDVMFTVLHSTRLIKNRFLQKQARR